MIHARVVFLFLLISAVAGVCQGQDARSENSAAKGIPSTAPSTKAAHAADRVVLKVGDVRVTQADFEAMIGDIEPQGDADKAGSDDKDRRRLGDDYASVLMLSQQAVANHLDASPEIRRKLIVARMQILSDAEFARLTRQSKPSQQEIEKYYSGHLADFDRVKLRRLFIWKVGEGSANTKGLPPQAARARADAILQASAGGEDPGRLADAFKASDEGMLDPESIIFTRGGLPPTLEKVAFALKPGEWAEGEESVDKVMLIHLVERDRRPLAEVSSLVAQYVESQKLQAELDELKQKVGIWMDEQYFGSAVATDTGEQRPVSNPPSKHRKSAEKRGANEQLR